MSFLSEIGRIAGQVVVFAKQLLPLIPILRQAIPAVDRLAGSVEGILEQGEVAADDLVDEHDVDLARLQDSMTNLGQGAVGISRALATLRDAAAATDDTPDRITPEEAYQVGLDLKMAVEAFAAGIRELSSPETEAALMSLAGAAAKD